MNYGQALRRQSANNKMLSAPSRTQDPHHPHVFGARVVIAHPLKN